MILVPKRLVEQKYFKSSLLDRLRLSNINWQIVSQMRSGKSKWSFAKLSHNLRQDEDALVCRPKCGSTLVGDAWMAVAGDVIGARWLIASYTSRARLNSMRCGARSWRAEMLVHHTRAWSLPLSFPSAVVEEHRRLRHDEQSRVQSGEDEIFPISVAMSPSRLYNACIRLVWYARRPTSRACCNNQPWKYPLVIKALKISVMNGDSTSPNCLMSHIGPGSSSQCLLRVATVCVLTSSTQTISYDANLKCL